MNKNKKNGLVVGGIVVLVAVFYGGMVYGKSQVPTRGQAFGAGNFAGGAGGANRGARTNGGFTAGQIIAKDATSITVQLVAQGGSATAPQGSTSTQSGSKIIFLDNNTKVSKQATGTITDLAVGTEVSVTGIANSDGSINAQSVQIRPNTPQGAKVQ